MLDEWMDIRIIFQDSILSVDRAFAFAEIWCWRFLFGSEVISSGES